MGIKQQFTLNRYFEFTIVNESLLINNVHSMILFTHCNNLTS